MPRPPEEVLADLQQAITDAQIEKRRLHEEIQEAKAVIKTNKQRILTEIVNEVSAQVKDLTSEARIEMRLAIDQVITGISDDWRKTLGL